MPLPRLSTYYGMMGSDPEFFVEKEGEIMGSELFIPESGLYPNPSNYKYTPDQLKNIARFVRDGVQVELNHGPYTCRQGFAGMLQQMFRFLVKELKEKEPKANIIFDRTVTMTKKSLDKLSEKSRVLGCAPSLNIYNPGAQIGVDPKKYMKRSAGGHIHLGVNKDDPLGKLLREEPEKMVLMLDVFVGNMSVLLDKDEGNIERRKVYGRAGEYRLPEHGIEYRTPSNFWLESPLYLSFVFGMARLATSIVFSDLTFGFSDDGSKRTKHPFVKDVLDRVDMGNIIMAINNNDFDLALKNYKALKPWLNEVLFDYSAGSVCFEKGDNLDKFEKVAEKGILKWVEQKPMDQWFSNNGIHWGGFGHFLNVNVR